VVVVDPNLQVIVWNHRMEDLWGLRGDEVEGKHFLNLDIGLPVEKLKQPLRACLAGDGDAKEVVLEATNRRGRTIKCELLLTPLSTREQGIRGVILLMQER
jgi:two-component system CheB/CheR fusion protein